MKVLDVHTCQLITVPDDHTRCSVCGNYKAPEEFSKHGDANNPTRTNCVACHLMPWSAMRDLAVETEKKLNSREWKDACDKRQLEVSYFGESISVKDLIEKLSKLDPDSRILATQDGYYAQGIFAYLHDPELKTEIDGVKFYSISHSSQQC